MSKSKTKVAEIEFVPDAWPRFERFICDIAKAGPQHRVSSKSKQQHPTLRRAKAKSAAKSGRC